MDLNDLLVNKRKYKNLKENIESIIKKLNSAIENLEVPSDKIKNLYNIDSISIDEGKLKLTRQDLINIKNYLKNIVLVKINSELKEINENIESIG